MSVTKIEDMRRRLADTEREYLVLGDMERYKPSLGPRLDFLERKIAALRRNIDAKARSTARVQSRVMQDPYLGGYVRSFMR